MNSKSPLYLSNDFYYKEIQNDKNNHKKHALTTKIIISLSIFATFILSVLVYLLFKFNYISIFTTKDVVLTTDLTTTDYNNNQVSTHIEKRWIWALGMAVFNTVNFGFSVLGLVSSCTSYSNDGSVISGSLCVIGAIATAVTIGGRVKAAYDVAQEAGSIAAAGLQQGLSGISSGVKRSSSNADIIEAINTNLTQHFGMPYRLHGFVYSNSTFNGHMIPGNYSQWPVFELVNHHGNVMHHMMIDTGNGTFMNRLGYASYNMNRTIKRDTFNNEYFDAGAIDFSACSAGDSDQFNTGDFGYVEPTIECIIGTDVDSISDMQYQIFDITNGETAGAGSIAGVGPDGRSEWTNDVQCPTGLAQSSCAEENSSGT